MSVQFEEQNIARQLQYTTFGEKPKGISGKLISWGVAKDEKSANKVLIGVVIVLAFIIILFLFQLRDEQTIVELTPEEKFELERMGADQ